MTGPRSARTPGPAYRAKQVTLQYLRPVIGVLRDRLQVQYPDSAIAFLNKVEFIGASDVAERLFPLGRTRPIVLDPTRSFGEPTVPVAGVRTEIIAELVDAGEEPARIAEIYSISVADVEQVVDVEHHFGDLGRAA